MPLFDDAEWRSLLAADIWSAREHGGRYLIGASAQDIATRAAECVTVAVAIITEEQTRSNVGGGAHVQSDREHRTRLATRIWIGRATGGQYPLNPTGQELSDQVSECVDIAIEIMAQEVLIANTGADPGGASGFDPNA